MLDLFCVMCFCRWYSSTGRAIIDTPTPSTLCSRVKVPRPKREVRRRERRICGSSYSALAQHQESIFPLTSLSPSPLPALFTLLRRFSLDHQKIPKRQGPATGAEGSVSLFFIFSIRRLRRSEERWFHRARKSRPQLCSAIIYSLAGLAESPSFVRT